MHTVTVQTLPDDEEDVPTKARGRGFTWIVILAWPLGLAIGLVAALFGVGLPFAIASGLSVALGINFVWVVCVFAIDDGQIDEAARARLAREGRER